MALVLFIAQANLVDLHRKQYASIFASQTVNRSVDLECRPEWNEQPCGLGIEDILSCLDEYLVEHLRVSFAGLVPIPGPVCDTIHAVDSPWDLFF